MLLDDFSLSINEPGIYYLSGEGGSGKSTFLKLLMGIYEPQLGNIEIFGQDLRFANKNEIRKTIAFASEEATLLGDSIFESVSYSRKDENKLKVVEILEKIGFFKKHDPENLNKILQKNKGFSKSEEKILILCRAVLMDKKIMLFDDWSPPYQ
ncbi:MAG: ATP-binding cassette domain-containing protein [Crocinitomicaceae bacterium]|nr:ATP-binding cassette domain-containing protein [Crocinitomicaceae bacterium]